ncbi:GNAT family N-acetyltransferase [Planococcus sp. A6]|uniref:GNAT family N-acetyltransferase n=1 Tax=Planococcus sp. A6 TaxID=2992760 RepID=UPI00237BB115|nr:GNAT family N-acetyltransferase [Planococcus sp. A6]MDE0581670.1 GNAT family N-acetyltransferase [Planococcus sp. A6]
MDVAEICKKMKIHQITGPFENEARTVVLKGLEERFGFIDPSYNPDLKDILSSYSREKTMFFVCVFNNAVISTGAVSYEAPGVGRIERMSVLKEYRRGGIAKTMLQHLESWGQQQGYEKVVLETNKSWTSAIEFYKKQQYEFYLAEGDRIHFFKRLV